MKRKNITLIFPPLYFYKKVYPSIHYLKSFIESLGYEDVYTINQTQDFLEYSLSKSNFEKLIGSSPSAFFTDFFIKNFKQLDKKPYLTIKEAESYIKLSKAFFEEEYITFFKENAPPNITDENSPFFEYIILLLKKNLLLGYKTRDVSSFLNKTSVFFEAFYKKYTIPQIREKGPVFIGISLIDHLQIIPTYTLVKLLKKEGFDGRIFLGGPFFSKWYKYIIEDATHNPILEELSNMVDGIMLFEGENIFKTILANLDKPSLPDIPNLIKNGKMPSIENKKVRNLPTPDFSGIKFDGFYSEIPYLISRGCYWRKCSFCKPSSINKFVSQKAENVIHDLIDLKLSCKTNKFHFCDEAIPLEVMSKVCDLMQKNGMSIRWSGNARFEKQFLNVDFCKTLKVSGCEKLMFGLESGSQRILDLMNKGIKVSDVRIIFNNLKMVGIKTHLYLIFGFPTETDRDAEESILFLEENKEFIGSIHPHEFILEKGSSIHINYKSFGIKRIWEGEDVSCYEFEQEIKNIHSPMFYCRKASSIFAEKRQDTSFEKKEICVSTLNFNIDEIKKKLETGNIDDVQRKRTSYLYSPMLKKAVELST